MRKIVYFLFTLLPFVSAAQTNIKYLDVDGKEIGLQQFQQIQAKNGYTVGQNDAGNVYRLIKDRERKGKITDYKQLISSVNTELNLNLSAAKPLFVYYSPGPDVTNTTNRLITDEELESTKLEALSFEKKLQKEVDGQVLYVFKKPSQFAYESNKRINWRKDPKNEFEKRFFSEYHYQYASFVLIFPNGDYNVYLGEFSYSKVFDYVKNWKKNNKVK